MKQLRLNVGDIAIINGLARTFYPHRIGQIVTIKSTDTESKNTDYIAETKDGCLLKFRDVELNKLSKDDYILQFEEGQTVLYKQSSEVAKIEKIDHINRHVEIKFGDEAMRVVSVDTIKLSEKESDSLGETKSNNVAVGLIDIFISQYKNEDGTYTIPKSLLDNLLTELHKRW